MSYQRLTKGYMFIVLLAGAAALSWAVATAPTERVNLYFLAFFFLTVLVGSRMTIQIPRFKSHIAVSDTFIFLAILIFGGELAVILAAVEAFFASRRFCNKLLTVLFNVAAMSLSTSAVVFVLKVAGLYSEVKLHGQEGGVQDFGIALSLIALTQFIANTGLAVIHDSLKGSLGLAETWNRKYLWSFLTYFVGALSAGLLVKLSDYMGFGSILAGFPVVYLVFLSYRMYLTTVEMSIQQAEQAKEYARVLEQRSNELRDSEQRFRSAFTYAPIGIALVSPTGNWLKVNRALTKILGYSSEEFLATDFQSMIFREDLGATLVQINELLSGKINNAQIEQRYVHKEGHTVWVSWSGSVASDMQSDNRILIFQLHDITDKKLVEQRLQHEATHDALTGLPNRAYFMRRLAEALQKFRQNPKYQVSVLFIDIDRFKYVNDSLGHLVGDRLLMNISERLSECMRPPDIVARLGGDEFVILVEGRYYNETVTRIAERIQRKFSMPFQIAGHEVYSSASIGILHASEKHYTSEDMMRDADTAMYQAKRAGKARHEIFHENMHHVAKETLRLEMDLRRAVEKDEFEVAYQPIFSVSDGSITSVEALLRWNHPELGDVPPGKFIPLAEELGLIDQLSEMVLRRACLEMVSIKNLLDQLPGFRLAVNLSCQQFVQKDLVGRIVASLESADFPASGLRLEITESVVFEHQSRAIEMLHELRRLGIEIAIDDFGTGYSNLSYLVKLPIASLKVDRAFVSSINHNGENSEMVRTIVTMAHGLGLKVVAEGVESEVQLEILRTLHCESAQGFLLARPMKINELSRFIEGERADFAGPLLEELYVSLVQ